MSTNRNEPPTTSEAVTTQPPAKKKHKSAPSSSPDPSSIGPKQLGSQLFFRILDASIRNIVAGYASPAEELARAMMSFRSVLGKLQINKAMLVPDVAYGASSGDALVVLTPESVPQYDILEFRSGLVAIARRYNALSERVKENAHSTPRMPVETIVSSKTELAVLRGLAQLREVHCSIWVTATDGRELEIVPPKLEDLSSPPKPKKISLENVPVTGCELGQEGTHTIVVGFIYRLRMEGSEESMIEHLCRRERFTGRISKVGNEWYIEDGCEYHFA